MKNSLKAASVFVLLGVASVFPLTASAQPANGTNAAQTVPLAEFTDPLVAYKAYDEALTANRFTDAARIGTKAWQLAEAKWGASSHNTGALAYNAAWISAIVGKSSERVDAARRAVELAGTSRNTYSLEQAQFLLAYSEYFATPVADRPAIAAKLADMALPIENSWDDFLIVNALVEAAKSGPKDGATRGRQSVRIADRALAALERVSPDDKNYRISALFSRAQGRLIAGQDQDEAMADLIQARVVYGPMRENDDKTWGALAAWETVARSIILTLNPRVGSPGSRISRISSRPIEMTDAQKDIVYDDGSGRSTEDSQCDGVKRDRRFGSSISYPRAESAPLRVAGVVLQHDMDSEGRAINVRLLGAVPVGPFGDSALQAVQTWRYTVAPNTPAHCLTKRNIMVSFAIG